jgi:hypothetical protein
MNRRNFMHIFTLGAIGTTTPALANKTYVGPDPKKDGPICGEAFNLTSGTKRKPMEKIDPYTISFHMDPYEEHKTISMSVGQDGNLWIRTENGDWKRVVTE